LIAFTRFIIFLESLAGILFRERGVGKGAEERVLHLSEHPFEKLESANTETSIQVGLLSKRREAGQREQISFPGCPRKDFQRVDVKSQPF
jgi:hypothetical protein